MAYGTYCGLPLVVLFPLPRSAKSIALRDMGSKSIRSSHSSKTLRRVCCATSAVLGNTDHIGFAGKVMDVRVVDAIENCFLPERIVGGRASVLTWEDILMTDSSVDESRQRFGASKVFDLRGRKAIVTGDRDGLGRAIVEAYVGMGASRHC
jgi:hypothetical protein